MPELPVAGVDGCRAGWLCVTANQPGFLTAFVAPTASALISRLRADTIIGIDIPIGLPTLDSRGAEREARSLIGIRRSSVFQVPLRAVLHCTTHSQASAIQVEVHRRAKRLSVQSFAILPKIREVDQLIGVDRGLLSRLVEVHPEASFWCWNDMMPLADSKKTKRGRESRAALIEAEWPGVAEQIAARLRIEHRGQWMLDDLYDAFAALWSAQRYATGRHLALPAAPEWDEKAIPMRIVV